MSNFLDAVSYKGDRIYMINGHFYVNVAGHGDFKFIKFHSLDAAKGFIDSGKDLDVVGVAGMLVA